MIKNKPKSKKPKSNATETVEDGIKNLITKEIDEQISSENLVLNDSELALEHIEDEEDHAIMNKLLSSFPSAEGFYGKLYRKRHDGTLVFKSHIDILEEVDDPELTILNMMKENKWEDGDYVLRIFKRGYSDCKKTVIVPMYLGISNKPNGDSNGSSLNDKISEVVDIASKLKSLGESSSKDNNQVTRLMAESFNTGLQAMTNIAQPDSEDKMIKTINVFKELGLLNKSKSEDSSDNFIRMLTVFKELNILGKPEEKRDIWEDMIKLKELGLIKLNSDKEDDILGQIEKVKSLIDTVSGLSGLNNSGEKPTLGVELVKILAPQLPKVIENITSTVNNVISLSKAKLANKYEVPLVESVSGHRTETSSVEDLNPYDMNGIDGMGDLEDGHASPSVKNNNHEEKADHLEDHKVMNPLIKEVYNAIKNNNTEFYPQMVSLIKTYVNPGILESIVDNETTIDQFLTSLKMALNEPFFEESETKEYFSKFLTWYIEDTMKDIITAECESCETKFDFDNEEAFNKDSKICECGGKLKRVHINKGGIA